MDTLLQIYDLSLRFKDRKILSGINLNVFEGEILAIVGESGSGKSMLARSILRLNNPDKFKLEGKMLLEGKDISLLPENQLTQIRGRNIGIIFQEPLSYLNPTLKMKSQLTEPLIKHNSANRNGATQALKDLLDKLGIRDTEGYMRRYPHQLSGGMAQRGMIAMASSCLPKIIIADEPTSSLDTITQASIVNLLKDMSGSYGISVIFITHDLELAGKIADRAVVMSEGTIVEQGDIKEVFNNPKSKAAKGLLSSGIKGKAVNNKKIEDSKAIPIIEIRSLNKYYKNCSNSIIKAVDGVSLRLYDGETLGLLGESGCGKSTLARLITRVVKPSKGEILYDNMDIFKLNNYAKKVQMIFQDPFTSLDPQMRIVDSIAEGIDISVSGRVKQNERCKLVRDFLTKVGLDISLEDRFPHQLSGGQRQRASIARALIMNPKVLVCDEPTSYLDRVSQAQIIDLFAKLKEEEGLTYLFITHDMKVLSSISDRIAVMYRGRIVELGKRQDIMTNPLHPYTDLLIKAAYSLDQIPSHIDGAGSNHRGNGCSLYGMCDKAQLKCAGEVPGLNDYGSGHFAACHYTGK